MHTQKGLFHFFVFFFQKKSKLLPSFLTTKRKGDEMYKAKKKTKNANELFLYIRLSHPHSLCCLQPNVVNTLTEKENH